MTYTRNGVSVSSTVYINVLLPTLDSYTATQDEDVVWPPGIGCSADVFPVNSHKYTLGCEGVFNVGISFTSSVHIPALTYLSDPAQTGIKYVLRVSAFRKLLLNGAVLCRTRRTSENAANEGWVLDGGDPYAYPRSPIHRFSEGNSLTLETNDSPGNGLEGSDALKIHDPYDGVVSAFINSLEYRQRFGP